MKPTVIITGASGLLGRAIIDGIKENYQIIALDKNAPSSSEGIKEFIRVDLTDIGSIKKALEKIARHNLDEIYSVIHLAAYYDFSGEPSPLYKDLTVEGTKNLLECLQKQKFRVGQFIFSSTHLVMKSKEKGESITEEDELEATWEYPRSKILAEINIRNFHKDIPVVIFRISGAYDEFGHSPPICNQIKRIYERKLESFFYPGDEHKGQPFVHISDIVESFKNCLEHRSELGSEEIFLIAEQNILTYRQLQNRIGQLLYGTEWMTFYVPKFMARAGAWIKNLRNEENEFIKPWMIDQADAHYPVSCKRAQEKLGWIPKHNLYDDLAVIIDNLTKNPAAWYSENGLGDAPSVDVRVLNEFNKHKDYRDEAS